MLFAPNKSVVCYDLESDCQAKLKSLYSKVMKLPFIFFYFLEKNKGQFIFHLQRIQFKSKALVSYYAPRRCLINAC